MHASMKFVRFGEKIRLIKISRDPEMSAETLKEICSSAEKFKSEKKLVDWPYELSLD